MRAIRFGARGALGAAFAALLTAALFAVPSAALASPPSLPGAHSVLPPSMLHAVLTDHARPRAAGHSVTVPAGVDADRVAEPGDPVLGFLARSQPDGSVDAPSVLVRERSPPV